MPLNVKISAKYTKGNDRRLRNAIQKGDWLRDHMYNIRDRARAILVEEDHVRTWSLFGSIRVWKISNGYTVSAGNYQPASRPSSIYAGYVEGGTRYHPAYPYLGPAAQEERPKIYSSAVLLTAKYLSRK